MASPLETVLAVQEHDLAVDRLLHRRETLPERVELEAIESENATLEIRLTEVGGRRDELERRQTRLEEEVAAVERRIAEVDRRLYSGEVSASRELQAMSAEVDSLKERATHSTVGSRVHFGIPLNGFNAPVNALKKLVSEGWAV